MIPFLFSKLIKNVYVPQAAVFSGFHRDLSFLEGGAEEHRGAEGGKKLSLLAAFLLAASQQPLEVGAGAHSV